MRFKKYSIPVKSVIFAFETKITATAAASETSISQLLLTSMAPKLHVLEEFQIHAISFVNSLALKFASGKFMIWAKEIVFKNIKKEVIFMKEVWKSNI